jgi:hypothetical protein
MMPLTDSYTMFYLTWANEAAAAALHLVNDVFFASTTVVLVFTYNAIVQVIHF